MTEIIVITDILCVCIWLSVGCIAINFTDRDIDTPMEYLSFFCFYPLWITIDLWRQFKKDWSKQ